MEAPRRPNPPLRTALTAGAVMVAAVMVWQALVAGGNPDPLASQPGSAVLDIGVLVFREGLESILVLAAITATMVGAARVYRRPVAVGAGIGLLAALATWKVAVGIVLLVMVGEQAQEMQLAHWLPTTTIPWLTAVIPAWAGLWFAVFPTVETLAAQLLAAGMVLASYGVVRGQVARDVRRAALADN